jgi:hypothetical protein
MSAYQRLRRLYPLKPHVKKGKDPLPLRQPQYAGVPGWLLLTHDSDGSCVAYFVDHRDTVHSVCLVLDERMFSDTILRVTQLGPNVFLACDLRVFNGKTVVETMSYAQRRALLDELLSEFHSPDLGALLTYEEVPPLTPIRGWETYDDTPGTLGVFLPTEE